MAGAENWILGRYAASSHHALPGGMKDAGAECPATSVQADNSRQAVGIDPKVGDAVRAAGSRVGVDDGDLSFIVWPWHVEQGPPVQGDRILDVFRDHLGVWIERRQHGRGRRLRLV